MLGQYGSKCSKTLRAEWQHKEINAKPFKPKRMNKDGPEREKRELRPAARLRVAGPVIEPITGRN